MTQTEVLHRARQGDAAAIAHLINTTLNSKGISAKVELAGDRLLIIYSATRSLNADTLVSFTQTGIRNLKLKSIQTVQVFGLKIGSDQPLWQTTFLVSSSDECLIKQAQVAELKQIPVTASQVAESRSQPPLSNPFTSPVAKLVASNLQTSPQVLVAPLPQLNFSQPKYLFTTSFMILSGFLLGGAFALLNLATANTGLVMRPRVTSQRSDLLNGDRPPDAYLSWKQQAAIQTYLQRMNAAQQEFYVEYGRFTNNLEELERFAAVISQSRSYTIKFVAPNRTQTQITATAKTAALKSYVATVLLTTTNGIPKALASLCETQQPARILPLLLKSSLRCPSGMVKLQLPTEAVN